MIGTSLQVGETTDPNLITQAVAYALEKAHARRHSDRVSALILMLSAHWAKQANAACQLALRESRTLQIWGGVCQGVVVDAQIEHSRPAVGVAIIPERPDRLQKASLTMSMGHDDLGGSAVELASPDSAANDAGSDHHLGLISHGVNSGTHPRIKNGRVTQSEYSQIIIHAHRIQSFDSLGLEQLSEWKSVSQANGNLLQAVEGENAMKALASPLQNAHPVALRVGVKRDHHIDWLPVVEIHSDGSISLAGKLNIGATVCLAARTSRVAEQEISTWGEQLTPAFKSSTRKLIAVMGGFERSPLCHMEDPEWHKIRSLWPNTPMIGGLGQAAWIRSPDVTLGAPGALNHRLSASFICF
jgi:hypothetical protein